MGQAGNKRAGMLGIVLAFCMFLTASGSGAADLADMSQDEKASAGTTITIFSLKVATERMTGDTTYAIGAPFSYPDGSTAQGYFPLSELQWPLDVWLVKLSTGLAIGEKWRVNVLVKTEISDPDDAMTDRDWFTAADQGQLDVYSKTAISDFSAFILDLDVEWTFWENKSWSIHTGVGYQYQKFSYEGQLLYQYSPSGIPGYEYVGSGAVTTTYKMTYSMPYLLLGTEFQLGPALTLGGRLAYSPLVTAEDEDQHLLRKRLAEGDMEGDAYMLELSGSYKLSPAWFIEGGLQYTRITVDGDMKISMYGLHLLTETEEADSTQTSGYLSVGYIF